MKSWCEYNIKKAGEAVTDFGHKYTHARPLIPYYAEKTGDSGVQTACTNFLWSINHLESMPGKTIKEKLENACPNKGKSCLGKFFSTSCFCGQIRDRADNFNECYTAIEQATHQ